MKFAWETFKEFFAVAFIIVTVIVYLLAFLDVENILFIDSAKVFAFLLAFPWSCFLTTLWLWFEASKNSFEYFMVTGALINCSIIIKWSFFGFKGDEPEYHKIF